MSSEITVRLSDPVIAGAEEEYVRDAVRSGWVSGAGPYIARLERGVADRLSCGHAVATSSGTAALHIALLLAGVRPGDEVLISNLTFIATANAVRYCGATPVVIDAEPLHWQIDCDAVEAFFRAQCQVRNGEVFNRTSGRRVAALVPVHAFGYPCDMERLLALKESYPVPLIEDAAGALGSTRHGRAAATFGEIGCLSFNGNKIVTTGGGGMIVTRDAGTAARARHLVNQAKSDPVEYIHDAVGFNYRLSNLQAAFGCAQLEQLPRFIEQRRALHRAYREGLAGVPGLHWLAGEEGVFWNGWQSAVLVEEAVFGCSARSLREYLLRNGVESRPFWRPVHLSPAHAARSEAPQPVSERLYEQGLNLPAGALTPEQSGRLTAVVAQCHMEQRQQRRLAAQTL